MLSRQRAGQPAGSRRAVWGRLSLSLYLLRLGIEPHIGSPSIMVRCCSVLRKDAGGRLLSAGEVTVGTRPFQVRGPLRLESIDGGVQSPGQRRDDQSVNAVWVTNAQSAISESLGRIQLATVEDEQHFLALFGYRAQSTDGSSLTWMRSQFLQGLALAGCPRRFTRASCSLPGCPSSPCRWVGSAAPYRHHR